MGFAPVSVSMSVSISCWTCASSTCRAVSLGLDFNAFFRPLMVWNGFSFFTIAA